ncbi:MAG: hypothetical protein L6Q78_00255 [Bacteroidia bacterium]|nr:hypothetical protein [Bacteroidia bacterium]
MEELALQVSKTARILRSQINSECKATIFGFHGYGQSADDLWEAFSPQLNPEFEWIFPEALNVFYPKGLYGKTGNSWMTSKFRLHEIEDYRNYIRQVAELKLLKGRPSVWLGFSQGVTTLLRALETIPGNHFPGLVICIAGSLPSEWNNKWPESLKVPKLVFLRGDKDQLISKNQVQRTLNELNVHFNYQEFQGKHELNDEALSLIIQNVNTFLLGN